MTDPIVHVIDDDDAMRDSLAFLLDVQGFAVRVYDSAQAFLDALPEVSAGCVVTDIRMPGMTGLELVRKLKQDGVAMPVVVMTGHGDVGLAVEAMKAGVVDFIEKPFSDEAFIASVKTACALAAENASPDETRAEARRRLTDLSPREQDVLNGVVAGKANKIIAFELGISPRTVEIYRANLMTKTGARNISELMRIALNAGL
jgi:two-component system, LuxR family, response regulator FixJ